MYAGPIASQISLLIVQPTPFCNIDCDYCYLSDRDHTGRLSRAVFRDLLAEIFECGLAPDPLSIIWHAGEPLVVPIRVYAELLSTFEDLGISRKRIRQSIQTNATLLTDEWCQFIKCEEIKVGVSLDGPAFLHDRHRRDRLGRGTHDRALSGLRLLQKHGIDFHVIAVVTADSLDHADEIFDFFSELGVSRLGFNIEELEGRHQVSSLVKPMLTRGRTEKRLREFWRRLYSRQTEAGSRIQIREFARAYRAIVEGPSHLSVDEAMAVNPQTVPLGIVSCDWQGNLSTFSPELLGVASSQYDNFTFARAERGAMAALAQSSQLRGLAAEIFDGVRACSETCSYFRVCGGGAPANKWFENGSFASTETTYCRATVQMPLDLVLGDLESTLATTPSTVSPLREQIARSTSHDRMKLP